MTSIIKFPKLTNARELKFGVYPTRVLDFEERAEFVACGYHLLGYFEPVASEYLEGRFGRASHMNLCLSACMGALCEEGTLLEGVAGLGLAFGALLRQLATEDQKLALDAFTKGMNEGSAFILEHLESA